jgi:cytochrome P450
MNMPYILNSICFGDSGGDCDCSGGFSEMEILLLEQTWTTQRYPSAMEKKLIVAEYNIGEQFEEFNENFKARGLKHGGVLVGVKPFYIPIDPELVKHILLKDFQQFVNRGSYIDEVNDPLTEHILSMEDNRWKNTRAKLTPTFTFGKIK